MSVSTEVQRTLVKSPPELWAELSDPAALGRHLGDLGEIRITDMEPETKVEWEADSASGVVHLKQSGWGTKVTLSLTRELPTPDAQAAPDASSDPEPGAADAVGESHAEPEEEPVEAAARAQAETELEADAHAEPDAGSEGKAESEPQAETEAEPRADAGAQEEAEPEPVLEELASAPRPRFFARLFRRRRSKLVEVAKPGAQAESEREREREREPEPEPEFEALAVPELIYVPKPVEPAADLAADLAAELASMEAQMTEQTTELLTGVLDRLGAAHHRPFSRG